MGIEVLSAVLKENGHNVKLSFDPALFGPESYLVNRPLYVFLNSEEKIVSEIEGQKPDVLALSGPTSSYQRACRIGGKIKKSLNIPVIFGGIHATSTPQTVIAEDCVDYVIVGEAEKALHELLDHIWGNRPIQAVSNLYYKTETDHTEFTFFDKEVVDLDRLPITDKDIFSPFIPMGTYFFYNLGRGCPNSSCTFCSGTILRKLYGKKYARFPSVQKSIDELVHFKNRYQFKYICFLDDVFCYDMDYLKTFIGSYVEKVGLPYECATHPQVFSREIAEFLKETGCYCLNFGIQSCSNRVRREIINRGETDEVLREVVSICNENKLPYKIDIIFGLPTEVDAENMETFQFMMQTSPVRVSCFYFQYLPGTPILYKAKKLDLLSQEQLEEINRGVGTSNLTYGSVEPELIAYYKTFEKAYKLLPIYPGWIRRYLRKGKRYTLFRWIPFTLTLFIEVLISIKNRHSQGVIELAFYVRHVKRAIRDRAMGFLSRATPSSS